MPALVTAFDDDGNLDPGNHEHNVSLVCAAGALGVLVAGSTGEGPYLETGERAALVSGAREVESDLVILCGIFAESSRSAHAQMNEAVDASADALLVVTPTTLMRGRAPWISDYYEWVADASPIPVFLYSVPAVTGYELDCESVAGLAGHPNIAGMKDSGGDVSRLDELAPILSDEFIVYAGASRALADSFDRGSHGAITASANYAFTVVADAAAGNGDSQRHLVRVTSVVERHGVPGTKYAAALAGMRPGNGRLPLPTLDSDIRQSIDTAFAEFNTTS
ncbi:MAG: 4-hydroxy-tetrahydrodipicolinate synthase [Acidimicrobiia bacterium]|nr:MAG: 4-hydroxy-tetrahydrodipicolinate synthase [Acidimicrobiia bacterium]